MGFGLFLFTETNSSARRNVRRRCLVRNVNGIDSGFEENKSMRFSPIAETTQKRPVREPEQLQQQKQTGQQKQEKSFPDLITLSLEELGGAAKGDKTQIKKILENIQQVNDVADSGSIRSSQNHQAQQSAAREPGGENLEIQVEGEENASDCAKKLIKAMKEKASVNISEAIDEEKVKDEQEDDNSTGVPEINEHKDQGIEGNQEENQDIEQVTETEYNQESKPESGVENKAKPDEQRNKEAGASEQAKVRMSEEQYANQPMQFMDTRDKPLDTTIKDSVRDVRGRLQTYQNEYRENAEKNNLKITGEVLEVFDKNCEKAGNIPMAAGGVVATRYSANIEGGETPVEMTDDGKITDNNIVQRLEDKKQMQQMGISESDQKKLFSSGLFNRNMSFQF
jgi:hypothetical protein